MDIVPQVRPFSILCHPTLLLSLEPPIRCLCYRTIAVRWVGRSLVRHNLHTSCSGNKIHVLICVFVVATTSATSSSFSLANHYLQVKNSSLRSYDYGSQLCTTSSS